MRPPRALQRVLSLFRRLGRPRRPPYRLDPLRHIYLSPF